MSRKTELRPYPPIRRILSSGSHSVSEVPRTKTPLPLVCGVCGASGSYHVGTVLLDPNLVNARDPESINAAVGFSGYFRCRKCEAGGPWGLPNATRAYVMSLAVAATSGKENVPLAFGAIASFDRRVFRYATDCEAHLKALIDQEPERAFLWVRLGNLYCHSGVEKHARTAFERAIELDPQDIEAHAMLGRLLAKAGRFREGVPHWHAVLKYARDARQVKGGLRRNLVRAAIEYLLEAHAESHGQIDLLPAMDFDEYAKECKDEPVTLYLREIDLGSEKGLDELCNMYVGRSPRRWRDFFRRSRPVATEVWKNRPAATDLEEALKIGRNHLCPCGSGHKYKKCCGR